MSFVDETVKKIRNLEIRGAREVALESIKTLKKLAEEKGFGNEFEIACDKLANARPTAVAAYNSILLLKRKRRLEAFDELLDYWNNSIKAAASHGSKLIKDNDSILVHCGSFEMIEVLKQAKKQGKKFNVFVTETRPNMQGINTAKELVQQKIPVCYIIDSAAGFFARQFNMVLVGADALRKEGLVNKIGTYLLALCAKENNIPFYSVASTMKIDKRKNIVIEERPAKELINPKKLRGVKICNPVFDITPWKFVTVLITEKGILSPQQIKRLLKC